ncbi:TetR family transcriptional regulator [Mycobacterium ulcerans]|uniref:TetR family transcriptional regulator n=1 Tax=Mycobacterium ulcerans TaxID=1809 RepID=UPI00106CABA6|nr:TetR family transcriptional regulator [Mycobacterium ulcerans]
MTARVGTQLASPETVTAPAVRRDDRILDIVVHLLQTEGYDAVQLREVARRARTSLATIYKRYANRDKLILAALEFWMDEHHYAGLAEQTPAPGECSYAGMMRVLRTIFQPWETHPDIVKAYFRARAAPGGQRLVHRGLDMVVPAAMEVLAGVDEDFIHDLDTVISSLVYGLLGRFTAGEIAITEILPSIDRTVFWLIRGYEASRRAG